jgi:hypothetical protein
MRRFVPATSSEVFVMAEQIKFRMHKDQLVTATLEFHQHLGAVMRMWSGVERALYNWFERATGMPDSMARGIFYGARGFSARAEMLESTLEHTTALTPAQSVFVKEAVKKARQYSGFRNRVAHGEPRLTVVHGEPTTAHYVIVQGKDVASPDEFLSIDDLDGRIHTLQRCATEMHPWLRERNKNLLSPEECLAQVRALPNQPHDKSDPIPSTSEQPPPDGRVNKKAYRQEEAAKKANPT